MAGTPEVRDRLIVPQVDALNIEYTHEERICLNHLLRVIWDLIERRGIPRSLTAQHSSKGTGDGPPPAQRQKLDETQSPHPNSAELEAAQILMSQRTPMIIEALLKSLWVGGKSSAHVPDAWILSRLWKMIREYDMNRRILSYHLYPHHETPEHHEDQYRYTSHMCDCWAERLGIGWDEITEWEEMSRLPPLMNTRPPDKLKRMLTATLDQYVKRDDNLIRRNNWIKYRTQQHVWAFWVKPFIRAFLEHKGMHEKTGIQYWYMLDEDARNLGFLTGYNMETATRPFPLKEKIEVLSREPPPVPDEEVQPMPRGYRDPNDMYMLDEFLLVRYLRLPDHFKTSKSILRRDRDAFFHSTKCMRNLGDREKRDQINRWYNARSNPQLPRTVWRGNRLILTAEKLYNQRAAANKAPLLRDCWANIGEINEEILQEAITAALVDAEAYRTEKNRRYAKRLERRQEAAKGQLPPEPVPQLASIRSGLAQLLANTVQEVAPPPEDVIFQEGPPLTLEEIYLIATGITETLNADMLPSHAIRFIVQHLRDPAVLRRIMDNIYLVDYKPYQNLDDVLQDTWRFDLAPPPPPHGGEGSGGDGPDGGGPRGGGGPPMDDDKDGDWFDKFVNDSMDLDNSILELPTVSGGSGSTAMSVALPVYIPVDSHGYSMEEYDRLLDCPQQNQWLFNLKEMIAVGQPKGSGSLASKSGNGQVAHGDDENQGVLLGNQNLANDNQTREQPLSNQRPMKENSGGKENLRPGKASITSNVPTERRRLQQHIVPRRAQ